MPDCRHEDPDRCHEEMDQPVCPLLIFREGLVTRVVDEELVVYDPVKDRIALLNSSAAVVLELCDGSRTEKAITEAVAESFSMDPSQVAESVAKTLSQLRQTELFENPGQVV